MKQRPLSEKMIDALRLIHRGCPFGLDRRTENALYWRGLAYWVTDKERNKAGRIFKRRYLQLSHDGHRIVTALQVADLVEAGAVMTKHGLAVIDGGKPDVIGRATMPWPEPGGDAA